MKINNHMMHQWIFVAFIAPCVWAIVNVIDVYFVDDVYEDEYDGTIVTGMTQLVVWIPVFLGFAHLTSVPLAAALWAFGAGVTFLAAFLYYFRALFRNNDMSVVQMLWNVSIVLVPFFSWAFFGEVLRAEHYLGISIAFAGAMLLSVDKNLSARGFMPVFRIMAPSVVLLSLSMVFGAHAYHVAGDAAYWTIFCIFSSAQAVTSLGFLLRERGTALRARVRHLGQLWRKYFWVFATSEILGTIGYAFSNRALSLAPSAAFVAMIESLIPLFVMLISAGIVAVLFFVNKEKMREVYAAQYVALPIKICATGIIAVGIWFVA